MDWIFPLALFVIGLPIGSFLNVVIWRLPRGESVILPSSHCPKCNAKIKPCDNIPIISYIVLGGKCRNCKEKIAIKYPVVEFITALSFCLAWFFGNRSLDFFLLFGIVYSGIGIAITIIDIDHRIIPDELSIGGLVVGLALSPFVVGNISGLLWSAIGALVGATLIFLIRVLGGIIFKKEAMGFGDVKLMAMIGAFVGWDGVLLTVFLASLFGAIGGIIAMIISKETRKERLIPFGPFLILGGYISLFWGGSIIAMYLELLG